MAGPPTTNTEPTESNLVFVDDLPSWIRTSEFVEQFEIDFPGQPIELPPERNFPFPTKVDEVEILNHCLTMFDSLV
jgi:hypothetical protein